MAEIVASHCVRSISSVVLVVSEYVTSGDHFWDAHDQSWTETPSELLHTRNIVVIVDRNEQSAKWIALVTIFFRNKDRRGLKARFVEFKFFFRDRLTVSSYEGDLAPKRRMQIRESLTCRSTCKSWAIHAFAFILFRSSRCRVNRLNFVQLESRVPNIKVRISKWYRSAAVVVIVVDTSSRGRRCRTRWSRFLERHWVGHSRLESVRSYDKCRTRCIPDFFLFSPSFSLFCLILSSIHPYPSLPTSLSAESRGVLFCPRWDWIYTCDSHGTVSRYYCRRRAHMITHVILSRHGTQFMRWRGETIENRKKGKRGLPCLLARVRARGRYSCIFRSISFCSCCVQVTIWSCVSRIRVNDWNTWLDSRDGGRGQYEWDDECRRDAAATATVRRR